jgi:hypothetical protein
MAAPELLSPKRLELPYRWNGVEGEVRVEIGVNDDPAGYGCEEVSRGFPYCRATIHPPARGYGEMLGWIQIVDTDEDRPGFRHDRFDPLGDAAHPFGFFGFSPTLFDLPHTYRENWNFHAHTFLCGLGGKLLEMRKEARAILGFSWGFSKRGEEIEYLEPAALGPEAWDGHQEYLHGRFRSWSFTPGFHQHPLRP